MIMIVKKQLSNQLHIYHDYSNYYETVLMSEPVFHIGFKRGMASAIIRGHLIMNAGHAVDLSGHFQHRPSPIKGTNRIS